METEDGLDEVPQKLEEVVYLFSPLLPFTGIAAEQAAPLRGDWVGGVEHEPAGKLHSARLSATNVRRSRANSLGRCPHRRLTASSTGTCV